MKKKKIYLDTSVINFFYADDAPDFKKATIVFFENYVVTLKYDVYVSDIVINEILKTSDGEKRKQLLAKVREYNLPILRFNEKAEELASKYIEGEIIPIKKIEDAQHIALATIERMDILLSWNFKHLANVNKREKVKLLNEKEGYFYPLDLLTPLEVMYEDN